MMVATVFCINKEDETRGRVSHVNIYSINVLRGVLLFTILHSAHVICDSQAQFMPG